MTKLYELNHNGVYYRFSGGEEVQTETYTWASGVTVETNENYLNCTSSNDLLNTWISDQAVDRLYITIYTYENGEITEATRSMYQMMTATGRITCFRKISIPEEQLEDSKKLIADGMVNLFEIKLSDGTYLHLKNDNSGSWGGYDWTGIPIGFDGYSSSAGDNYSRPSMSIANPDGAFSTFVRDGYLNRAVVTRYLVLYDDYVNNRDVYQKRTWIIWAVKTLNKQFIQLELRNPIDGVNFDVPARMYIPPEFPFVEY